MEALWLELHEAKLQVSVFIIKVKWHEKYIFSTVIFYSYSQLAAGMHM